MYLVDKLNLQLDSLVDKIHILNGEKHLLEEEIQKLKDQHDVLKRNNENMLINIDKALYISNAKKKQGNEDDISYQS